LAHREQAVYSADMPTIVGIINCTPDSFSDRETALSEKELVDHARALIDDGAEILDIGGDSTRPNSDCVGVEEEWRRIKPVLKALALTVPCSVDTHNPETARRALSEGARYINDISGYPTTEMIDLTRDFQSRYIGMFNAHGRPHQFGSGVSPDEAILTIASWMKKTERWLIGHGLSPAQIILDPGMGAFVSSDSQTSWTIIQNIDKLPATEGGLLLGCSRKGFLKTQGENHPRERDYLTACCGAYMAAQVGSRHPLYLRVHNVALQRKLLDSWDGTLPWLVC
jgi:dihydropteroate synthase